jgi:hypothetical protein
MPAISSGKMIKDKKTAEKTLLEKNCLAGFCEFVTN